MLKPKLDFSILVYRKAPVEFSKKSFQPRKYKAIGHKCYQPIWHMVHKLRQTMGKQAGAYILAGRIEIR